MTVLQGMGLVTTPPVVWILRVRGKTSTRTTSSVPTSPERIPPWTAAPWAATSSGLIPLEGSLPPKYSLRSCFRKTAFLVRDCDRFGLAAAEADGVSVLTWKVEG